MKDFPRIILIFLTADWPMFMRRKMLYGLAKASRKFESTVVAVNRPLCPFTTIFKKPDRTEEFFDKPAIEQLDENLYLFSPRYFINDQIAAKANMLEMINLSRLRKAYKYLCKKIEIAEREPIVWHHHPQQGYVTRLLKHAFNVLELYDNLVTVDGKEISEYVLLEKKNRKNIDLLLATSPKLLEKYGGNYEHAWFSGNGIDRETFERFSADDIPIPFELAKIPSPRIGYTGVISKRLDWDLVEALASKKPEWSFVFVGPVLESVPKGKLGRYPNIYFPGKFEHKLMPNVLRAFDLGMMPYKDNDFFHYSNPLKFYEFAAAGLRSISSDMEILSQFDPTFVRIMPSNADEWIKAMENMLEKGPESAKEAGRKIAEEHLWDNLYLDILTRMNMEFFGGK